MITLSSVKNVFPEFMSSSEFKENNPPAAAAPKDKERANYSTEFKQKLLSEVDSSTYWRGSRKAIAAKYNIPAHALAMFIQQRKSGYL